MAATDARPVPRKNVAYRFYFAIRKPSDSTLITTWTGQDSEVSLDGAAYSDCTNEATEIGTTGTGYIDLTSSEMNADCVLLKVTVTNTGAVPLLFALYPEESGDYRADMTLISGDSAAADNAEAFFDGTGYAGTNNVIPTVTTLTNLPSIPANWITAAGINASAFTAAKFDTACLTSAKFDTGAITSTVLATGAITNATFAAGAIDNSAIAADAIGSSELAATAVAEIADQVWDELLSGHVVSGSAGEALAAANAPSAAAVADAVWDEALAGHVSAGSTGEALNAAGGEGDPWITALPGAYSAGSAGYILGTNLNATVSSRASQTSVDTVDDFLDTEVAAIKAKTDNLPTDPADQSAVEAAITAATSPLATAANLATVAGYLDTEIAAILADTNELQTDWANGGRLDLILDARASQTSVDDVPTNAELAAAITTALTTALTEGYRATNATGSVRDLLYEILQNITEFTISSTTKTVKKLDGSTTAKTYTLNDGTTPTGITEAT